MEPNTAQAKAPESKPSSNPDAKVDLKSLPLAEVEKKLGSSADGLTQAEAQKRLTRYGPNEIEEKKTNELLKFLSYFWGPIPWMIEAAVILSAAARHWPDFGIILLLLLANAVVGFWEEHEAGNAIAALKATLAIKARVRRDGKWVTPPARELVPGDVIRVRLGDIVPADARLLEGDSVEVDQSALTGELLPATRKSGEAIFSGSIVRQGEIGALVYATGTNTYFGKTAELVQGAQTVSHFQRAVLKIGNYLIILAVVLVATIIAFAIFRGDPILTTLQFALVLTVAAIPVAMPTVLSVTMAVGARLLAKQKAIVTRLVAIEELAGVDVLCADKTGTLTQNKLTLGDPFGVTGVPAEQVILNAALASRADNNDTIDLAVLGGLKNDQSLKGYKATHFQPFDPVHKRTEAAVTGPDGKAFKVTKGAPQVILALSANAAQVTSAVDKAVNEFAARGFRSLGVARAEGDGKWQFLGVLPLFDPPRDDAKSTIATAQQMGVKVKMVTGDALAIAQETAKKLGMGTNILDANSLGDEKQQKTTAVAKAIENADGFAQVFPEHKFHIIEALQKRGHIVGMTGDGVNDAPALKKADCGIAVSSAIAARVRSARCSRRGRPFAQARRRATTCRRRTGLRHTAQEHLFEVVVQYPHHPRAGERVMVLRRVLHGARVHFVIEQPDGCRVLLPAWMTETSAAAMPMVEVPRLSLDALRELRGLIDAQRVSSSPSSETTRTGGGDDGTTCTMATTRSPGARDKRNPTPATRSDDSLGGRRSAQASSQRMQRRPRKGERGGR